MHERLAESLGRHLEQHLVAIGVDAHPDEGRVLRDERRRDEEGDGGESAERAE